MIETPDGPRESRAAFHALPQRRAYEEIILQIEHAIAEGDLAEGDRLPGERELAETFGVSRASVREALRVLETLGVLVARRGTGADSGSVVTARGRHGLASALRLQSALQRIPIWDFVDLRTVMEAEAAERAAQLDAPPTARMHELIEAMSATTTASEYNKLDTSFHVELARVSGNALIPLLMETLRDLMQRAMVRGFERLQDWRAERDRLIGEHRHIVERIEAHDPEGARAAIRGHILRFYRETIGEDSSLHE